MKTTNRIPVIMSVMALTLLLTTPVSATETKKAAEKMQTQVKSETSEMTATAKKAMPDAAQVNINTASVEQLQTLKGIGAAKAQAIVDYRTKNGKFSTIDDLANVSGVGTKLIEQNRHIIKL
ncbi:competence protein ComEA [Shewanella morhuae]|uniref:ComE operon protein 1 n=1 Tax=Shewanella morhuae TaxID=365591 RepID=A0A379ZLC9_9GAMM|nr:ComEA family DNA-binding protein [Shewanella morhuae]PTA49872.1 competence protein ComEA [Shewanella morhuae]GIU09101.1 competence protein ComEA [Shewanella morhuae]SUI63520.1 ComE operon protein 1 [Shewanella morhuae]